ncbi:hypothetical protein [Crossiella sp. CA198]|uniref:hypothetical protein n=1 Tax=Crossiella sp. CA198 TaxID=3455607 RepID=UPI003F8CF5CF
MAYTTIASVRAAEGFDNLALYPDTDVTAAIAWAETIIDDVTETSWEHKVFQQWAAATGTDWIALPVIYPRRITSARLVQTNTDLDVSQWRVESFTATIYLPTRLRGVLEVQGTAGETAQAPPDIVFAADTLARFWLRDLDSRIPDRAVSAQSEYGQIIFATASERRPTGLPDVDAILLRHSHRAPGTA